MPQSNWPAWWKFELELCAHLQDRMIDRGFSEADLRLRMVIATTHLGDAWEVVVEPDEVDQVIVVITAYKETPS